MRQTLIYLDKFLNSEVIQEIELTAEPLKRHAGCDSFDKQPDGSDIDVPSENSHTKFITHNIPLYRKISNITLNVVNVHITSLNVDIYQSLAPIQYSVYNTGSAYKYHCDTLLDANILYNRKLTLICLLSDPTDFTGGSLDFGSKKNVLKRKGSAVLFPSYMMHEVTPVLSGIRKTLVCMVLGPQWR